MASNLPIISFKTPGGRILIKDKKNGILINKGNFKEYVKKIINYKKNSFNCSDFNKKYLKKFDLKENALELIKYYSK